MGCGGTRGCTLPTWGCKLHADRLQTISMQGAALHLERSGFGLHLPTVLPRPLLPRGEEEPEEAAPRALVRLGLGLGKP